MPPPPSPCTRVSERQEGSTSAVFMLERVSAQVPAARLADAAAHLTALLAPHAASVTTSTLTADAPEVQLSTTSGHAVR